MKRDIIRIDGERKGGGRWAVLINGALLMRLRQRSTARALARASADEQNLSKCVVRRWRRK